MRKIWICGASGMLGSHFRYLLYEQKIPFIANDKKTVDITDLDGVSDFVRVNKISHIINCAAYTQVDQAEVEQKQAYLVNAIGPYHLGIAGRRYGARVLHFSTDYVFNGRQRTPYSERDPCSPVSAYGVSKLAGEMKLMDEYSQSCIVRTSWLFGFSGKNFVSTMLRLMSEKDHLQVVDDQIGRPTYCADLAEIALELLEEKGIFHFANSFETSWFQFAREIYRQAKEKNFPLRIKNLEAVASQAYPTVAKRPTYSTLDTKKIESYLSRSPRPWQEALYDYFLHLKDY